jgi:catechol O-methyltransferase
MTDDLRGSVLATRLRALPWAVTELGRFVRARLRGEPPVQEQALAWARAHAQPGDPASILAALDRFAAEQRFLMNVGEKAPMLEDVVRGFGPSARIVELGSFVGYSAIAMARHLGPDGRLISIDVSPVASRVSRQMAELAGVGDRTEFLCGRSGGVLDTLHEPFDVVFLDHWKGLYLEDARRILERGLASEHAVFIADNVGPLFGDNPYVPWMQARTDFDSSYVRGHVEYRPEIEDGVLVSRRRPHAATPTDGTA